MINFETIQVGDKVRLLCSPSPRWPVGTTGTVVRKDACDQSVKVAFPSSAEDDPDAWWFFKGFTAGSGESWEDIVPISGPLDRSTLTLEPVGKDGWLLLVNGERHSAFQDSLYLRAWFNVSEAVQEVLGG